MQHLRLVEHIYYLIVAKAMNYRDSQNSRKVGYTRLTIINMSTSLRDMQHLQAAENADFIAVYFGFS
jgi:hypothetical protein